MRSRVRRASVLVVLIAGLMGSLFLAAPAEAVQGNHLLGHRCRTYDAVTNEDTLTALIDTAGVSGASCEIDAWTIKDGTTIVWHDSTWGRVADHATLPAGIRPTDRVVNATWAQVSRIRTKGGAPVATLARMIDASGQYHVPLIVEVKNRITNPKATVARATSVGADVKYYKQATGDCALTVLQQLHSFGASSGLKTGKCIYTPDEMQSMNISFVSTIAAYATSDYVNRLGSRGIKVISHAQRSNAQMLISRGVWLLLVEVPRDAARW